MKYKSFTDTTVWQKAHQITLFIYDFTSSFPKEEVYNLTSQMRRSALSIEANIAEAFGRYHYLDKTKFYLNARGSLEELNSHCITATDLKFVSENNYQEILQKIDAVRSEINKVIKSFRYADKEQSCDSKS